MPLMDTPERRVVVDSKKRIFKDFFWIEEAFVRYERFDGQMSESVRRLSFERGDAAAAVIEERETGDVLLVEQFRYPTFGKGPGWLVETVAGIVEDGEDPEVTVRREVLEETGFQVRDVELIATFYPSPGGSSERIFLYHVEVSASDRVAEGGGVGDEHEDIRLVRIVRNDLAEAITSQRFSDAKTIIGLQWLLSRPPSGSSYW